MLDQHEDGSHEITLHDITCPGRKTYARASGMITWSPDHGIRYSLDFAGLHSLQSSEFYAPVSVGGRGVGRFSETNLSTPQWMAKTDDGTVVKLFGVIETPRRTQTRSTSSYEVSCGVDGRAMFVVVEIPYKRLIAFENGTQEDFRMFFIGRAGRRHHLSEEVTFVDIDGTQRTTRRCSITLSESLGVSMVRAHGFVRCQPAGWLAFRKAPVMSDCEIGAFPHQNFVSFLNGQKVGFYWTDRRVDSAVVRRTYFGWVKSTKTERENFHHQPLPFMDGIEEFDHGDDVLKELPRFFEKFVERSSLIDFGIALHPLWTALESVLQDRLALASISLERLVSLWDDCRKEILTGTPASDSIVWNNKGLLKKIRGAILGELDNALQEEQRKEKWLQSFIGHLLAGITSLLDGKDYRALNKRDRDELREVLTKKINNLTAIPNAARLKRPFDDLDIQLSDLDNQAIKERNTALHGRQNDDERELHNLERNTEYFDCLRMLLTRFVLKVCDYHGPYIDYASRPPHGNFEIKRL